jgi:hypothetical protein
MKRLRPFLLAIVLLLAGCGHPLIPAADIGPGPTARAAPSAGGGPVVGVDLYALSDCPPEVVEADGERTLRYIKTVLKANAVAIVWNLYAPSRTSDEVQATARTLSVTDVEILTEIARLDGLSVFYRPLIFVSDAPKDPWEGTITPRDPARWFASYYEAELPYLRAAQQFRIAEFVAGTELHAMNASPGWTGFFGRLASVYRGVISYASWDGDYFPPGRHLQQLAALGMDMYERMPGLAASAPEAAVLARWDRLLGELPRSVLARTTIQEMGIEAAAGAYQHPADLGAAGAVDPRVQANWFTAACQAAHRYDLHGLFFWKVDLTDNPAHPAASPSTFEGRLGALAIASCASILG